MAGPHIGIAGGITWDGTSVAHHLAEVGNRPLSFRLNFAGEGFDATAFDTAGMAKKIKGIRGPHSGSFEVLVGATTGTEGATNGLVTYASGTALNLRRWTMNIRRPALQAAAFTATVYSQFPGITEWGGSFEGFLDNASDITNMSGPGAATFQYLEASPDHTLSGSIFTTAAEVAVQTTELGTYSYDYMGSDALTQSTVAPAFGVVPDGALAWDAASSLQLTSVSGISYTMSAFWTSIDIECAVGQVTKASIGFAVDGDVTIS